MNAAARDALQVRLAEVEKRLGHDEAEVRDREASIANFKARVDVQRHTVTELKEELEENA